MKKEDIDVLAMMSEKLAQLQQTLLPLGYSKDRIRDMVTSYRQGILDTLVKLKSHKTDKEE